MAASTLIRTLVEAAAIVWLARLVAPEAFGLVGMATAVTGFVALFKDAGLSSATISHADITPAQLNALFWVNSTFSLVLGLSVAGLGPLSSWYFDEPQLTPIFVVLAFSFVFDGLTVQHRALLRRRMLYQRIAVAEMLETTGSLLSALLLAYYGFGYWALVGRTVALSVFGSVLHWFLCAYRPGLWAWAPGMGEFLHFGKHLTGFSFVNYFSRNLDDILIGRSFGATTLGLYQKAYEMLMMPLRQISKPAGAVAVPTLSRLVDNPAEYRRAYRAIVARVLAPTVLLGAAMLALPEELLEITLGARWVPAADMFFWMGWLTLTQPVGNSTGWVFLSQSRAQEMFRQGMWGALISVGSFLAGLPYGAVGVAAAYSISGIVLRTPLAIYLATKNGPLGAREMVSATLPFQLCGALAWLSGMLLREHLLDHRIWLRLALVLLAVLVTGLVAMATFPLGREILSSTLRFGRRTRTS